MHVKAQPRSVIASPSIKEGRGDPVVNFKTVFKRLERFSGLLRPPLRRARNDGKEHVLFALGHPDFKFVLFIVFLLSGCESMPIGPKRPDSCPRFPVNTTIPLELPQEVCVLQETLSQEETE